MLCQCYANFLPFFLFFFYFPFPSFHFFIFFLFCLRTCKPPLGVKGGHVPQCPPSWVCDDILHRSNCFNLSIDILHLSHLSLSRLFTNSANLQHPLLRILHLCLILTKFSKSHKLTFKIFFNFSSLLIL